MPSRSAAAAAALLGLLALAAAAGRGAAEEGEADDELSLLQSRLETSRATRQAEAAKGQRDLVLMHVPYNFGHTIEAVAMFGSGPSSLWKNLAYMSSLGGFAEVTRQASWEEARKLTQPNGEVWGHLNPDLQVTSEVTGCPMYYTPQKYWPKELAEKYMGNKTVFGLLRDPYERLIALFRGGVEGYGGSFEQLLKTCDVNSAVKKMMKDFVLQNDTFAQGCTFIPQAEYFDGPYGITLPVDNRHFPASANKVLVDHGYPDFQIQAHDILHVFKCSEVWAADLDAETRGLVKQVYARDFDLLCKYFNHCNVEENACLYQVQDMCPQKVLAAGYQGQALNVTL